MGFFNEIFGFANKKNEDEVFLETVTSSVQGMRDDLQRVNRAAADALSHHNRLEAEYSQAVRQADEWKQRAREALKRGDEELARSALTKGAETEQLAESMRDPLEASRSSVNQLSQQVQSLRQKIQDAERNARMLVARRSAAKAQGRIADAMAGLGSHNDAFGAISEYEERVLVQEAQNQVFEDPTTSTPSATPPEDRSARVDKDLEALKRELKS